MTMNLAERPRELVNRVPCDVLAHTAAFLLHKDSKSSYFIEGEQPPQDRIQRWALAIGEAGRRPLSRRIAAAPAYRPRNERFVRVG